MEYIIAVVCGDVEKAPILEDSKYELNTQILPVSFMIYSCYGIFSLEDG